MKRTPLRKVSEKQAKRLAKYRKMVGERVLEQLRERGHNWCELSNFSQYIEPHHPRGRSGDNLFHFWLINPELHRQIHENPNWARKMGYLER